MGCRGRSEGLRARGGGLAPASHLLLERLEGRRAGRLGLPDQRDASPRRQPVLVRCLGVTLLDFGRAGGEHGAEPASLHREPDGGELHLDRLLFGQHPGAERSLVEACSELLLEALAQELVDENGLEGLHREQVVGRKGRLAARRIKREESARFRVALHGGAGLFGRDAASLGDCECASAASEELVAGKQRDHPLVFGEHQRVFGSRAQPLAEGVGLEARNDLGVGELHRPLLRGESAGLRCDGGRGDGEATCAAAAAAGGCRVDAGLGAATCDRAREQEGGEQRGCKARSKRGVEKHGQNQ